MASVKQGVTIKGYQLNNPNAKYKLKYTLSQDITIINGKVVSKYTYSKLITPTTKKYSYN